MTYAENALDALGNPTRRQILQILARGPRPVGAIAAELPVSRPAVSKHLRILRAAALVVHESQGTQNVFRLRKDGFDDTAAWLGGFEAPARAAQSMATSSASNGAPNGASNGASNGAANGAANGASNGAANGPSNGASYGSPFGAAVTSEAQPAAPAPLQGVDRHEG